MTSNNGKLIIAMVTAIVLTAGILLAAPPAAPTSFYGDTPTADSITWHWNDVSGDEDGFEIHETTTETVKGSVGAGITSYAEPSLNENTQYSRHAHSFKGSAGGDTVEIGTGGWQVRGPLDTDWNYALSQQIYLQSEIGQAGTITKVRFYRMGYLFNYYERFETGGGGWTSPSPAWYTTTPGYSGYSARSGVTPDNGTSYIERTFRIGPTDGTVTFYWKVSSELNGDYLRFYIDGVEQGAPISGEIDWTYVSLTVPTGTRTLRWAYTKNGSVSSGSDCGYLDEVNITSNMQGTPVTLNNVTISMSETTSSEYAAASPFTDGTLVWSGTINIPETYQWIDIPLSTTFSYSNTQNLLVTVRHADGTYENADVHWRATALSANRRIYAIDDYVNPPTSYGVTQNRPDIQLVFSGAPLEVSGPSNDDSLYTAVHDPLDSDFSIATLGGGQVQIDVTPPTNSTVLDTGVKVERDGNGDFTGGDYAVVQDFAPTYTGIIDSGLVSATYFYRIIFQNAEQVPTNPSNAKSIYVEGPLDPPLNFSGSGYSTTQILWEWNPPASGTPDGYQLENESATLVAVTTATSYIETVSGENDVARRHLRSAVFGSTSLAVDQGSTGVLSWPWTLGGRHMQFLYTAAELSGQPGVISKIYWHRAWAGASETYQGVAVMLGHAAPALTQLGAVFADNFTEGDSKVVRAAADYTVPVTAGNNEWVEIPISDTDTFYYDGVNNLVLDIDLVSGTTDLRWTVIGGLGLNTALYSPPGGTTGTPWEEKYYIKFDVNTVQSTSDPTTPAETAYSLMHDAIVDDFTLTAFPTGTTVLIEAVEPANNPSAEFTGVRIERADDLAFTLNVTQVQPFMANYSCSDTTVPAAGTYYYRITYCNGQGVASLPSQGKPITVPSSTPEPLIANFTGSPTSGTATLAVTFLDSSTGNPTAWSWTFGDGGSSTEQNPVYDYTTPGLYTVSLTASTSAESDIFTRTDYITVSSVPVAVADFVADTTSGPATLTVSFTDLSTVNNITSWSWTFGDGGTSTSQNPVYDYATPGLYTVSLTVIGDEGTRTETKTDYITVSSAPVAEADFVADTTSGPATLTVSFTDLSTVNNITSWSWTFGDGGTSTSQNPVYDYATPGLYTVSLTVIGDEGTRTETKVDYITVSSPGTVVANFTATPLSGPPPLDVAFTDTSAGPHDSWSWNFGDGGTSTEQNPTYTYNIAGTYTVTLTIDGPEGSASEQKADYITVTNTGTVSADFSASPTGGAAPLDVQFTDLSVGSVTTWEWDFGDGGTSTDRHPPLYQYTTTGSFTVTLTVRGPGGIQDTEIKTGCISVTAGAAPAKDKSKGGCSCSFDREPTPARHLLGCLAPVILLAYAYFCLRARATRRRSA